MKPSPKIAYAAGLGAPLALVISWVYGELGGSMPAEVAGAFGALVAAAVGYFKREF
jgi:hypothetical protein